MIAIEAKGIKKSFGKKIVLDGIDLNIRKGTIHAILGPNGSGKTTLIKILSTLLKVDEGSIRLGNYDVTAQPEKVRECISLIGQNASVDEELTGFENLYLIARLMGFRAKEARERSNELLRSFDLSEASKRLVKAYSGGMRRRLDIAASIVKITDIVFLDEPTSGLDPRSRNALWNIIRNLAKKGTTILLTTQYLDEAEQLADKITVINHGKVISEGTTNELKASVGNNLLHVHLDGVNSAQLETVLKNIEDLAGHYLHEQKKLSFQVSGQKEAIAILDQLERNHIPIAAFNLSRPDLNEVFLSLTGKPQEAADSDISDSEVNPPEFLDARILEHSMPQKNSGFLGNKFMFGWRNLIKIKHIPEQFVDALITPVMFTFMFTYIFGGALAGSVKEYLQFLIPGILVQTLTFNSMYAGININNDISKGIFDRFRSMPIWLPAPLSGIFIGDFFRHLVSGSLVFLFGIILGFRPDAGFLSIAGSFLIILFFALSLSWFFIIMGLTMRSVSAVMSFGWIILMPLVFMSNIFADPATMPKWLQVFIKFNPLAWQVDAVRGILSGSPSLPSIVKAVTASGIITAVLFPLTVWIYKKER